MDGRTKFGFFLLLSLKWCSSFLSCLGFAVSLQCDEPKWAEDNGRICAGKYKGLHLQGNVCHRCFVHILFSVQFVKSVNPLCSLSGLILAFFPHGGEPLAWSLPQTTP